MDDSRGTNEGGDQKINRRQFLRSSGTGLAATAWTGSHLPSVTGQTSWEEIWRFEGGPFTASPTIVDGIVYATDTEARVFALSAESGELLWQRGLEVLQSWGAPVVSNGTVFVGGYYVHAFDARTGDTIWVNRDERGATGVNVADGIVFAQHGDLAAFDATTGERLWKHSSGDDNDTSPTVANGTVFFGSTDDNVYALDTGTGDEHWHFETGGSVDSSPTVSGGTVFVGSNDDNVYAIDAASGQEEWHLDTGSPVNCAPTVADATVFFGNRSSDFFAVDAATGEERWRVDTAGWVETAPTVVDGTVIFGSWDGIVYGVDATTGDVLWRFETEGESRSSAPTVVNGTAFFGDSAGNLYAVDAGVDGSSEDSRVLHGTLGHHGEWYHAERTFDSKLGNSGPEIENLRLVQTVENTRYVHPDSDRSGHPDRTPVADDLVADDSHDAVPWTAPEADLVAQRAVAPVFDVTPADPEEQPSLSLTARLVGDDEVVREERATLDAAALRGELSAAHRVRLQDRGVVDDEPAPLLESIRDDPDRVEGEYPTLPIASGADVEVELDGPGLERPITETLDVDSDRVRGRRRLSIGFVAFETETWTGTGDYTFDDDAQGIVNFATNAARWLNATFPTVGVDIAVVNGRVDAPTANDPRKFRKVVRRAESKFAGSLDDLRTFHVSPDGELSERTVHSVDAAVAVVPQNGFFGGGVAGLGDEDTRGLLPTSIRDGTPIANAVIVETGRERTMAHELVHLFAGEIYEGIAAQSTIGNSNHASDAVTSTGFDIQDGEFETVPGARSLMESGTGRWIDEVAYQALIENVDPIPSLSPRTTVAWGSAVVSLVASLRRDFENLPESFLERVPEGHQIRDQLVELEAELAPTIEESEGYWDATADFTEDQRESIRQAAMFTGAIGDQLVGRGSNPVGDTPQTAEGLGKRVKRKTEAIEAAMDGRRDGGVEHVVELDGTLGDGEEIDLEARTVPTVEPVEPVDGRVSIRALDVDGEVIEETSAATGVELLGQAGAATREDVFVGTVRAPAQAASVEVAVESADDDGAVRSTTMHPATDPIRTRLEALPDRAFDRSGVRSDALEFLDSVESHVESGDRDSAAETFEQLFENLLTGFDSEFRRQAGDETVPTTVLDRIAEQIHRFGGEVPDVDGTDDGLPTAWLLGGAGGATVAAYTTKRYLDDPSGD